MEVVVISAIDLDFNKARSPPYLIPPSTATKRFGENYCSAPTSPRHLPEFYRDYDDFDVTSNVSAAVPFDWEEKPGTPKSVNPNTRYEDNFAFDVGGESEKTTLPAEELFAGGKIWPFKPPLPVQLRRRLDVTESRKNPAASPMSPTSQVSNFRRKKKEFDLFAVEREEEKTRERTEIDRGRERGSSSSSSSRSRRGGARSLSPTPSPTTSAISSKGSSRKWRLKDFFLFRSASEGRAADIDPLKKYTVLSKKHEDVKIPSSRSIEGGANSGSGSKRRGLVSAHELHYTVNRAVSEDLKKKTFLPYKQGILGRLAFNPAVHALANGFGISRK
ncbi:hypothetical protein U1Q18_016279 [Sarracenia purpurea var. burkii]